MFLLKSTSVPLKLLNDEVANINYSLHAFCHQRTNTFDCRDTVLCLMPCISSQNSFCSCSRFTVVPTDCVWSKFSWAHAETHENLIRQENMDSFCFLRCSRGFITTLSNMANIFIRGVYLTGAAVYTQTHECRWHQMLYTCRTWLVTEHFSCNKSCAQKKWNLKNVGISSWNA